ncbi:uncharacterized protein F5Z01DRAFT_675714 [Emericellopsis atlantica]|uniref:Uncharacterized protein n=1 Tax=Emericellopsis atlantica TaxID=2614577 RepID=A0A9P7ZIV6_9HYPO|nr:uncharacterized protein F5Z01DRAFT_675714 [Emericellopsis atlantica]KAG9252592.1 hypothetical protein F5Z01DRAFT_675714 [Emericellopsis atlantica]
MAPAQHAHRRRRLASGKGAANVEVLEWTIGGDDDGHENSAPPRRRRKRRSQIPQSIFVGEDASRSTTMEATASVPGSTWPSALPSNDAALPVDDTVMPTTTSSLMDFVNAPPFVTISVTSTTASITSRTSIPTARPTDDTDSSGDSLSDSGIDSSNSEDDGEPSDSDSEDDQRPSISPRPPPPDSSGSIRLEPPPSKSVPSGQETGSTSSPNPNASAEASREAEMQHHQDTRMALIIVGSIAGVVCLGIGLWFLARCIRRRQDPDKSRGSASGRYRPPSLLRRVPFLERRYADRTWLNIDAPEKTAPIGEKDLLAYLPDKPPAVQPDIRVTSATLETYAAPPTAPSHAAFGYAASNPQPPYSPTESSLSSAYGNGTFIPPTPLHPPPRRVPEPDDGDEMFPPPLPVMHRSRDTVYTQYSQASSVPQFRTVSMWVRHQIKRLARDPVPEQGYGLMMPDEEAPRRVVVAPQGVGYSQ